MYAIPSEYREVPTVKVTESPLNLARKSLGGALASWIEAALAHLRVSKSCRPPENHRGAIEWLKWTCGFRRNGLCAIVCVHRHLPPQHLPRDLGQEGLEIGAKVSEPELQGREENLY